MMLVALTDYTIKYDVWIVIDSIAVRILGAQAAVCGDRRAML
jgi:hypothetical protein